MAIKWPLANGNWSNAANWNDGTLPDIGDDVHADGKTVTIDQDVTVLSIRNDQRSGGTANGGFNFATTLTSYNITADLFGFNANLITLNQASRTYNFIGNVELLVGSTSTISVILTSSNNNILNITGNIYSPFGTARGGLRLNNSFTILNIIGNISGGASLTGSNSGTLMLEGVSNCEVTITGNLSITGSNPSGTAGTTVNSTLRIGSGTSANNIFIYGNVFGNTNQSALNSILFTSGINTCNIFGKCVSGVGGGNTINNFATNNFAIDEVESLTSNNIAHVNNLGINSVVKKITINSDSIFPIVGKFSLPTSNFTFRAKDINNNDVILTEDNNVLNFIPTESNVRKNTTYYDGLKVGTLEVPDPSNVRKGVPTDNTVGTAELTGEDILQAIQDSTTPLAERLRNVSTVQTTGDQISTI